MQRITEKFLPNNDVFIFFLHSIVLNSSLTKLTLIINQEEKIHLI